MSSTALLSNKSSALELVAQDDARETRCNRRIIVLVAERIPLVEARRAHENPGRGGITGKQILICDEKALGVGDWARSA
jgi:hypothetical protein